MRLLDKIMGRHQAYKQVFEGPFGDKVLADLRRFCKASTPSFVPGDPHATSLNEGRREVWNRIQAHLGLTDAQVRQLNEDYEEQEADG